MNMTLAAAVRGQIETVPGFVVSPDDMWPWLGWGC